MPAGPASPPNQHRNQHEHHRHQQAAAVAISSGQDARHPSGTPCPRRSARSLRGRADRAIRATVPRHRPTGHRPHELAANPTAGDGDSVTVTRTRTVSRTQSDSVPVVGRRRVTVRLPTVPASTVHLPIGSTSTTRPVVEVQPGAGHQRIGVRGPRRPQHRGPGRGGGLIEMPEKKFEGRCVVPPVVTGKKPVAGTVRVKGVRG